VRNRVGLLRVGETIELTVLRNGTEKTLRAAIEAPQLEEVAGKTLHSRLAGANFSTIQEGMKQFGRSEGILVSAVEPGSSAWQSGLREGDIIVSANRQTVQSLEALREAVHGKRQLLINLQRGNSAMFILIR
jgi:serine protease Do/serine protease DegQ